MSGCDELGTPKGSQTTAEKYMGKLKGKVTVNDALLHPGVMSRLLWSGK